MQRLSIDVTKIDKAALYKGTKGTYLNLTLMDNRDGEDQYGNHGFIVQDIGKERREAGEKAALPEPECTQEETVEAEEVGK